MTDILVALLISLLAGMGVGGGGLLVLYMTLVEGIAQREAQGINLIFFLSASLPAFLFNIRKRKLNAKRLLLLSSFGALFSWLGAAAACGCNPSLLRKAFGVFSATTGLISLFSGGKKRGGEKEKLPNRG